MKRHPYSRQHGATGRHVTTRTGWLLAAIVALVGASCGSGSSAEPATTVEQTTTTATTLPPTTTTIGDAVAESDLLADSLVKIPNYTYYDYDKTLSQSDVRNLNATPSAREVFSSLSRHIVAFKQHYIAEVALLELRDPTLAVDDVVGPVEDLLRLVGSIDTTSANIGDIEVVHVANEDVHMWIWIADGIVNVAFYMAATGNEDFGADFAYAAASVQQDLPIPKATATGIPSGSMLKVEDDHLASHLLPVGGYLYVDPPFDTAVSFYGWMEVVDFVIRASNHFVLAVSDLAEEDWLTLANVQVWEVTDDIRNDPSTVQDFINYLFQSWAGEGNEVTVLEMTLNGQFVKWGTYVDGDGFIATTFVFEHAGLVYIFHASPECADVRLSSCSDDVLEFVAQFAAASEQTS